MTSTDLLHVETYGSPGGRPLLAIHGITGFGARFERLAGLVDRPRWICPDLRVRLRRDVVAGATHVLFHTELEATARAMRPFLTR